MSELASIFCGAFMVALCVLLLWVFWLMFRDGWIPLVPVKPVDSLISMMDSHEAKLGTQFDELMALKARVRECEDRLDALEGGEARE